MQSKEILNKYIIQEMPNYDVLPVPGDGMCILHSFKEAMEKTKGIVIPMKCLFESLRGELLSNLEFYKSFIDNGDKLLQELENFLENPLQFYNSDTGDIFLMALGNAYNVNVVILQSNETKCWTTNLGDRTDYDCNIYFARSLSLHFDPIIPRDILTDVNDSDLEITNVFAAPSTSTPSTSVKTEEDFRADDDSDSDIIFVSFKPGIPDYNSSKVVKSERGVESGKY